MTETEYEVALARIKVIFFAEPGTAEGEELHTLIRAVEEYEEATYPIP